MSLDRRSFVISAAAGGLLLACHRTGDDGGGDDVTPVEDLMREHGVLRRVMYLYDEAAVRIDSQRHVPLDAVVGAATIIRRVIEDYHEKLEEELLFPRFEAAGQLVSLTTTLRRQHEVGRQITDDILLRANGPDRPRLAAALRRFNHMYRAHADREDTVLFPAVRKLVGSHAYDEMGEQFEDKERDKLGEGGFEHAVAEVATLEQIFGVADLAALTPA
ncbi:MAG TPA: hemerythrin domain-containing protein [Kofleriaceae bacterium]|jgi:hemerythrin-like domain-containing protein|nr:hemerythrin domain-containing protein [Kofleriaceae bacterium]